MFFSWTESDGSEVVEVESKSVKSTKRRWSAAEKSTFDKAFKCYIDKGIMPSGNLIKNVQKTQLSARSIAQIRVRANNIIKGKLK